MDIQKSIDRLDIEIEELKTKIDEEHMLCQDITDLEELIDKAIMFGDLCAKRDAKAQAVPEGYVLMPKEPTPKMIDATWDFDDEIREMSHNTRNEFIYKTMIEAQEPAND